MKRWGWKIILAALLVIATMGAGRVSLATENIQPAWAGFYDIIISTAEGDRVPAQIELKDWGDGQLAVHGDFQGQSLNQLGEYSGDPEGEGLKAHFGINFGLVQGFIDFTIRYTEGRYTIEGAGAVDSIAVGKMAATFSGQRQSAESAPPTPAPTPGGAPTVPGAEPPNYVLWAAGAAAVLVLTAAITSRRRRRGSGK